MKSEEFASAILFLTIFGAFGIEIWWKMRTFALSIMAISTLSILIPTYNDVCTSLVTALHQQAEKLDLSYEIIVADDGSTDPHVKETNHTINTLPHCRLIEMQENAGRAAIRNFLAKEAQYDWLLFIDSDMVVCRNDFLQKYIQTDDYPVVDGGVSIGPCIPDNLRSIYERASAHEHTVEKRRQKPYQDFHTANFLIRHDLMLAYPFNQQFRYYGYEDVLFGKELEQHAIPICHIDNPLSFEIFESNTDFVNKMEEGLRTLHQFQDELRGYSRLLDITNRLPHFPFRLWHKLFGRLERRNLTGSHPSLWIFKIYKLGYFLSLP